MNFRLKATERSSETEAKRKPTWVESLYDWTEAILVALVVVVTLFAFVFRVVGVVGDSMLPNLETGDRLVLNCFVSAPARGDIVVINRYTDDPLVKRVIAVGGDILDIRNGQVILNGAVLDEPFLNFGTSTPAKDFEGPMPIPEGYIFVIGDNRTDSHDSRYNDIGFVSVKDVVGVAVFRIWPLDRLGVPT